MTLSTLSHFLTLVVCISCVKSATHDELPQCGLTGVSKTRQSIVESPNYPNNYPTSTCWDYVIRSPYRCPTKFHIQFLDFHLESSNNCTNDYLAIGLENDGDDMDLLCGQVVGIKKYHTPGGILRLRFYSDASTWTTARGFKLLITRLACERDDYTNETLNGAEEDTEQVSAPTLELQPPHNELPEAFRNLTQTEQHLPYPIAPLFGWNIWPGFLPPSPLAGLYTPPPSQQVHGQNVANNKPCLPANGFVNVNGPKMEYPALAYRNFDEQKPHSPDQYVGVWSSGTQKQEREQSLKVDQLVETVNDAQSRQQFRPDAHYVDGSQLGPQAFPHFAGSVHPEFVGTQFGDAPPASTSSTAGATPILPQQCCRTSFNQKRFYLSSPGFPRTAFTSLLPAQQRDCLFEFEKFADSICQLRIVFKFFQYGHAFQGSGDVRGNVNVAIATSRDVCTEDFIEIDGERFCGCRTGYIYTSPWRFGGTKKIRMRMGYSGIPSNGFLLDIYQEECREIGNALIPRPAESVPAVGLQTTTDRSTSLSSAVQENPIRIQSSTPPSILSQQQLPLYQQPPQFIHPALAHVQTNNAFDETPYHPLQTPNINPFLPPHPSQLWPSAIQPPFADLYTNQFGAYLPPSPLYRHGRLMNSAPRAANTQQPVTVVETNSTRKEFYYFDGDETFGRLRSNDEPNDIDRNGIAPEALTSTTTERGRCAFSTMDVLRLTVDALWIAKPTCYAPLRSWFS